MRQTIVIGIEEAILCPVTYVRLVAHLQQAPEEMDFRIFDMRSEGEAATAATMLEYASALILARATLPSSLALAQMANRNGVPILFDIDDYLWLLPEYLGSQNRAGLIDEILDLCTVVTTPQIKLKEFISGRHPHLRIEILPNAGDLALKSVKVPYCVGFIANSDVFRLPQMRSDFFRAVRDACRDSGRKLHLYYFSNDVPHDFTDDPWLTVIWGGIRSYSSYRELMQALKPDLALVPLTGDSFAQYKSVIKFAEFAATYTLGIFSRVEPYLSFVRENEDGLFAENSYNGWYTAVKHALLLSDDECDRLKENAYRRFQAEFSKTAIQKQLHQIIQQMPLRRSEMPNSTEHHMLPKDVVFSAGEAYGDAQERLVSLENYRHLLKSRSYLVKQFLRTYPRLFQALQSLRKMLHIFG